MAKYNFDEQIDRRNTGSIKWDDLKARFGREDIISLWVADMDFRVAEPIIRALQQQLDHGVFGYPIIEKSNKEAVISWVKRRNGWHIKPEWITFCPGVVSGLNTSVQALTEKGDKVVVQPPVYPPFLSVVTDNERELVENNLVEKDGYYTIDFDDLDRKLQGASLFILCNPHNPVGRSWTKEELEKVAELCIKHNVKVVSDEIHADLHMPPHKHVHFASLSPEIADRTITFIAASKSFNIAGLILGVGVCSNPVMLKLYKHSASLQCLEPSGLGLVAMRAAYNESEEWLGELVEYLSQNADFVCSYIASNIPLVKARKPEATYLLWIDFRGLGMPQKELEEFIIQEAGLGLNDGVTFGSVGNGFMRMNLACPRSTLEKALHQLQGAIAKRFG